MKKLLVPLMLLLTISIISCKKDSPLPVQSQILGKWNLDKLNYKVIVNGVVVDESDSPGAPGAYMDFKSATTVELSDGASVNERDWGFDEPTFSISINNGELLKVVRIDARNFVFVEVDGTDFTTYFLSR